MSRTVLSAFAGDEGEGTGGGLNFMYSMPDMQGRQPEVSKNQHAEQPQGAVQGSTKTQHFNPLSMMLFPPQ
jgi:hypothetical protein